MKGWELPAFMEIWEFNVRDLVIKKKDDPFFKLIRKYEKFGSIESHLTKQKRLLPDYPYKENTAYGY